MSKVVGIECLGYPKLLVPNMFVYSCHQRNTTFSRNRSACVVASLIQCKKCVYIYIFKHENLNQRAKSNRNETIVIGPTLVGAKVRARNGGEKKSSKSLFVIRLTFADSSREIDPSFCLIALKWWK